MSHPDHCRDRLRRHARRALERWRRTREEIDRRRGQPPRPGEVFAFAATTDRAVLWAVLEHDPQGPRLLVVAADMNPWTGRGDVEVDAEAPSGALTLRCGTAVWLAEEDSLRRSASVAWRMRILSGCGVSAGRSSRTGWQRPRQEPERGHI